MGTRLIEVVGVFLLAGVVRLWLGGIARLWTIAPTWARHPVRATARRQALPH